MKLLGFGLQLKSYYSNRVLDDFCKDANASY